MKIKKGDLINAYAQNIGIETANDLIAKKIEVAGLEDKENYDAVEIARICAELTKEGGLIRIVAQAFLIHSERKMRKQMETVYKLRENFLKETSHRIFTPVAIIGGYAEFLLESSDLDDEKKELIKIIKAKNEEILKLVKEALEGNYLAGEDE